MIRYNLYYYNNFKIAIIGIYYTIEQVEKDIFLKHSRKYTWILLLIHYINSI